MDGSQARNGRGFSSSEAEEETVSSRNPRRGALPCYVTDPGTSAAWTPRDAARQLGGARDVRKESKADSLCIPIWGRSRRFFSLSHHGWSSFLGFLMCCLEAAPHYGDLVAKVA